MLLHKFLLPLCLLFFLDLSSQEIKESRIPQQRDYVNDFERIFTPKEIQTLDSLIVDFEKRTTIQIAIITIDTNMMKKSELDSWTLKVLRTWGVGQKDKNNGILIGISMGYRIMRIQNGYGIVKILSNQETKEIIDKDFIPFFKEAKYFEGTLNGLKALMKKLE